MNCIKATDRLRNTGAFMMLYTIIYLNELFCVCKRAASNRMLWINYSIKLWSDRKQQTHLNKGSVYYTLFSGKSLIALCFFSYPYSLYRSSYYSHSKRLELARPPGQTWSESACLQRGVSLQTSIILQQSSNVWALSWNTSADAWILY